ncbi:S-layer homology domain-containing protein [Thermotalea metallivorans]|uniref:Putative sporulation-specific glycosylase YdhD n=1 Tax=Thermotalea metallivorans TaxID=520762 RepID=A0A140LA91_9FIRM|nr:S-layer homology domain-containing protein [Thermotalea metallivorans]KXG77466.1 putative sporulation-specific glycosylase YdhD [Thermotalea metallivorans]
MKRKKVLGKIIALGVSCTIAFSIMMPMAADAKSNKLNMSYLYFGNKSTYKVHVDRTRNSLQEVSPSYFDIDEGGNLKLTPAVDPYFVKEMHQRGIKVIPFLSNHWNREAGRLALHNRETLAADIAEAISRYDLDGVNVDIENVTEADREAYTEFVKILREKLPSNKSVSVAVAANPRGFTKGWQAAYDYGELAKYSDYLMVMAYDESYAGGPAGPVASINFVEKSIQYALERVPREKIVLGIPFFGRYWKDGETYGGYGISLNMVESLVEKYNGQITFHETVQSPVARITVKPEDPKVYVSGRELAPGTYTIWYENEASIKAKLRLVQKYNLKGTGSWSLGQEPENTWHYYSLWLNGKYFSDIQGHWAQEDILAVENKGWMRGVSSTLFSPNRSLTRAQAASTFVRALGLQQTENGGSFLDVPDHHWAKKDIETAKQYGLIQGIGNGRFAPDEPVTREQMAAMLDKIIPELNLSPWDAGRFPDVPENSWSYGFIMKMTQNHIFSGYPDGTFRPKEAITRAQMASLINRIANYIGKQPNAEEKSSRE